MIDFVLRDSECLSSVLNCYKAVKITDENCAECALSNIQV